MCLASMAKELPALQLPAAPGCVVFHAAPVWPGGRLPHQQTPVQGLPRLTYCREGHYGCGQAMGPDMIPRNAEDLDETWVA